MVGIKASKVDAPDGRGGTNSLYVKDLTAGTEYVARAGDAICTDGIVIGGRAAVDEARLTGEALPA